jgi:glycosyltransferase involved in cell wall biosynthesis
MRNTRDGVLLCVRTLGSGGTERQAAALALGLQQQGYRVHVCCGQDGGFRAAELRAAGIPIWENPVQGLYKPQAAVAAMRLLNYLRRHRIGLVHTFDFPMNIFAAPVARCSSAVVLTSQRCFRDTIPAKYHRLLCWAHARAHGVITNSREVVRHLETDYGIKPGKVQVCYNGLDLSVFHSQGRHSNENLVIGTVSVLRSEKGLENLVRAFGLIAGRAPSVRLRIAGDGPERAALGALVRELGLEDRCEFISEVKDVAYWMRTIDIFVLPSHSEALSNALMEAMACGCAVVASRVGGNPELIDEGRTGFLCAPRNLEMLADRLLVLIGDPEKRTRLAQAAADRMAQEFSLETAVKRMIQIYRGFGIPAVQGGS